MPRANIYIRKENWDAWNSSGKSDMVNDLLQKTLTRPRLTPQTWEGVTLPAKPIELPPGALDKLKQAQASKGLKFCPHDQVLGFCKKGCK